MHNPTSAPLTALASHSRQPGHQELFVADRSGRLFNRWRSDNSGWSEWHTRGSVDGRVTSMTSVADGPYSQEVFVLLESGELLSSWWTPRHGWSPWTEMSFPSDNDKIECLTSFSRHGGHVELVVVSHAGDQYNRWTFEGEAWSEWQLLEGWTGTVRALAAVQSDQWSVVVAAIRQDGNLSSALFWEAANSNNWRKLPRPESEQPPDTSNRD
jgi:hypothetical protein